MEREVHVRKLIKIVSEPDADADVVRNSGTSLWVVKGHVYIQKRLNIQGEYAMEASRRTFNVVAGDPYQAVKEFLLKASKVCSPLQIVACSEVESVEWSAWVDAAVKG